MPSSYGSWQRLRSCRLRSRRLPEERMCDEECGEECAAAATATTNGGHVLRFGCAVVRIGGLQQSPKQARIQEALVTAVV